MELNIINGVTISPPVIGRIMMGKVVQRGDKVLPQKDDHFSVTTLVQNGEDRSWEQHPVSEKLIAANKKLTSIPVRLLYNDPNLSINNSYSCFDQKKGRVLCVGNGCKAKRATSEGIMEIDCPRPEACRFGQDARCANRSRYYMQIEGQSDELACFVLRSTSWNTLNAFVGRFAQLHGLTGGRVAGIPLSLVLTPKSTTASYRKPIYYADLQIRSGMSLIDAVKAGRAWQQSWADADLNLDGMEAALKSGMANSDFSDEIEDIDEWVSDDDFLLQAVEGRQQMRGLESLAKKIGLNLAQSENDGAAPVQEAETAAV